MACHSAKRMQAGIMRGKFLLLLLRQGFINVAHTKKNKKVIEHECRFPFIGFSGCGIYVCRRLQGIMQGM
jgi:hypothetical protein